MKEPDTAAGLSTVLITGARRGIGRAAAERFLREGWAVAINDVEGADLAETAQELGRIGGPVTDHPADVGQQDQVERMIEEVYRAHGRLDALVNNAAIMRFGPFLEYGRADFEASLRSNVLGPFLCTRSVAERWVREGTPGSIVMVSSVSAVQARPGHGAYGASKAALEALAKVAAMELAPHGIRVNCVAPGGPILTELVQAVAGKPGFAERILSAVPMRRMGDPAEVAAVISFLTGPGASYITGAVVVVDGGVSLGRP